MLQQLLIAFGFGIFWFVMNFMAILLSTGYGAPENTEKINLLQFIGIPLILITGYKIYTIHTNNLDWQTEIINFLLVVILPLILITAYIRYGHHL